MDCVTRTICLNLISFGQFTSIYKINDTIVRKVSSGNYYSPQAIEIEGRVYEHLGKNKRIARCIAWREGSIDLQFEYNRDLERYLKTTDVSHSIRYRMVRQAIEAVVFIHSKDVIHSDLSARQLLVDRNLNVRLSDFGGSSLQGCDALVMENSSHFLPRDEKSPNTVQSDLFALGSTIYEILEGKRPYEGRSVTMWGSDRFRWIGGVTRRV
ncbi:hypothetical protein N7488_010855 [Penicillium malachiteum]|nr:hypothetical protein N7488_010855 [Penicillium malachiteum]